MDGQTWGDRVARWLTGFAAVLLFLMMALTFADVIGRYVFDHPITGAPEMLAFTLGLMVFAGFAGVTRDRQHITVDLLESFYRGRLRYAVRLVVLLGVLGFCCFMTYLMFDQAEVIRRAGYLSEYLDLPLAPVIYAIAALAAVATILCVGTVVRYLRAGGDPVAPPGPGSEP